MHYFNFLFCVNEVKFNKIGCIWNYRAMYCEDDFSPISVLDQSIYLQLMVNDIGV